MTIASCLRAAGRSNGAGAMLLATVAFASIMPASASATTNEDRLQTTSSTVVEFSLAGILKPIWLPPNPCRFSRVCR
ncbi:MAG: hypothetical protein AB7E80_01505 [Hyphomicrobiaceae bacterium]